MEWPVREGVVPNDGNSGLQQWRLGIGSCYPCCNGGEGMKIDLE